MTMDNDKFTLLQQYLRYRIAVSGMGKCYIEYPPSSQAADGIKRPPMVAENNFELRFENNFENDFDSQEDYILLIQGQHQARISAQSYDDSQLSADDKLRFSNTLHYIYNLSISSTRPPAPKSKITCVLLPPKPNFD